MTTLINPNYYLHSLLSYVVLKCTVYRMGYCFQAALKCCDINTTQKITCSGAFATKICKR